MLLALCCLLLFADVLCRCVHAGNRKASCGPQLQLHCASLYLHSWLLPMDRLGICRWVRPQCCFVAHISHVCTQSAFFASCSVYPAVLLHTEHCSVLACVCKTATLQRARLLQRFSWSACTATSDNVTTRLLTLQHVNSWNYGMSSGGMTNVHT